MPVIIGAHLSKQIVSVNAGKWTENRVPIDRDLNIDPGLSKPEIIGCLPLVHCHLEAFCIGHDAVQTADAKGKQVTATLVVSVTRSELKLDQPTARSRSASARR